MSSPESVIPTAEAPYFDAEAPYKTAEAPYKTAEAPYKTAEAPYKTAEAPYINAEAPHMVSCHHCELVQSAANSTCRVCGHSLVVHKSASLQKCWSLLVTAFIFYIPANLLPIMTTSQVGKEVPATIISGVVLLWEHHSYFIAAIIFIFSLLVPLAKFVAIVGLCISQQNNMGLSPANKLAIYKLTEFVGRWSMVDVFVVGFLAALIQMGTLMSVHPGPAALAFAGMVIFTMLSANSIDPRIFWMEGAETDE